MFVKTPSPAPRAERAPPVLGHRPPAAATTAPPPPARDRDAVSPFGFGLPDAQDDGKFIFGLQDFFDTVTTGVGNVVGTVVGAVTGISVGSTTIGTPAFGPGGASAWHVGFSTTGRSGWLVQEMDIRASGTDATGGAITPASLGITPHYFEAWQVDAAGVVTPSIGGINDFWDHGGIGAGTKGHLAATGRVHFVPGVAAPAGMAAGNVANAGVLRSSVAAPPGLGFPRLFRNYFQDWDTTSTPPTDSGAAFPT